MRIERRRHAVAPPPTGDRGDHALLELLREEIERAGPLTFARFMQRALYEPGLGYYATSAARPSRAGDYLTAPELHRLFGHTLARGLHEMWQRLGQPAAFTLREWGAGRGTLALAIMEGLERMRSPLCAELRYEPVDLPEQQAALRERLRRAGLESVLAPAGGRMVGCVLATEYLDALPVHRVVRRAGRLLEIYVDWAGDGLTELEAEPSTPRLAEWFAEAGIELADGQRAEVNLAMLDWLVDVDAELERGFALLLDYAHEPAELYSPARRAGTLRAFRGQHVGSDVLAGVGRQDLTASIDLGALARGARRVGLDVLGRTSQAGFLIGCGLEEALAEERDRVAGSLQEALGLRAAVGRLLDPRALGGYAAVVLGRGVAADPPLRGLAYRLPVRA